MDANEEPDMGRYVPPEHEGTVSANKLAGKCVTPTDHSYSQAHGIHTQASPWITRAQVGSRRSDSTL